MRRTAGFLFTGFLLVVARPGAAWPSEMHGSLVETAFLISPAAHDRIPGLYVGTVVRGAREAKGSDERGGDCLLHGDAAGEAQRTLETLLRNPKWNHNFALGVGRLLHFAADSVATDGVEKGGLDVRRTLFTNHDFVVFRESRDDRGPLAAMLRNASKSAHFADDPAEDDPLRYRAAVNAIADVLLRLPPQPDAAPAPDGGAGLFVVDTLDTGLGGMRVVREETKQTGSHTDSWGGTWNEMTTTLWYDPSKSWGGSRRSNFIDVDGVHVMDRANRKVGDDVLTRMTIFNNTTVCATRLVLSSGKWKLDVPLDIPPRAIRPIEVRVPVAVAVGQMKSEFLVSDLCRTKPEVVQLTRYAKISGTTSAAPDLREAALQLFPTTPRTKRPFSN